MYNICKHNPLPIASNRTAADSSGGDGGQGPDAINEETVEFYYGNVCREAAEFILYDRGCANGLFLLRDSNSDFVLSLCHNRR